MPTDDERLAVARRLREVQAGVIPGTKTEAHPIAGRIIGVACGYDLPDFQGLLSRLADLIEPEPERTCHDTDYSRESITCSECGEITRNTLFWVDVDGGKTVKGHRPRFCSNCGARVIGEEAGDAD